MLDPKNVLADIQTYALANSSIIQDLEGYDTAKSPSHYATWTTIETVDGHMYNFPGNTFNTMSSLRDHKAPVQRFLYATLDDPTKRDVKNYLHRYPELRYIYSDLKPYNICYIYLAHRVWASTPVNPMSFLPGAPLGIGYTAQASVRQLRALRMSHVLDAMRWHPEYRALTPEQRSQYLDRVCAHLHKGKYPYNMDGCPRCGVPTYYGDVSTLRYDAVKTCELHVAERGSNYWRPILRDGNPNARRREAPERPLRLYPAAEDNPAGYKVSCSVCKAEDIRVQELDVRTPDHYNPRWMDL